MVRLVVRVDGFFCCLKIDLPHNDKSSMHEAAMRWIRRTLDEIGLKDTFRMYES